VLGVFSEFGVSWSDWLQQTLETFNLANVDGELRRTGRVVAPRIVTVAHVRGSWRVAVEVAYIPCAGLDFGEVWFLKAVAVPVLYLLFSLVHFLVTRLLSFMAANRLPPTSSLLRLGWRPVRVVSSRAVMDIYGPGTAHTR
jgi:hypothetical protein